MTVPAPDALVVLADDLTGAADAGAAFAAHGARVALTVTAQGDTPPTSARGLDVLVVDAEARAAHPNYARAQLTRLLERLPEATRLFAKIDSTLRGPIALTIRLARRRFPGHPVVLAPAFPRQGRIARGGTLFLDGVPLECSSAWARERTPAPRKISDVLGDLPARELPLSVVRSPVGLLAALEEAAAARMIAVCDAEHNEDLDAIIAAGRRLADAPIWVGSAGLAAAAARALAGTDTPRNVLDTVFRSGRMPCVEHGFRPFLAVVGTQAPRARSQIEALLATGAARVALPVGTCREPVTLSILCSACEHAARSGDVVVVPDGPLLPGGGEDITRGLAAVAQQAATRARLLLLVGGATAHAVLDVLGHRSLEILGELEPGLVVSRPWGSREPVIVTRAGAFGDAQCLARAVASLRGPLTPGSPPPDIGGSARPERQRLAGDKEKGSA